MEDIEATIKHVSTSKPDIFFTTVSYPIKGTPYYNRIASRIIQISPWGKTSDRELEIKGRHSRAFYTHADRVLRDEVALARMLDGSQGTDNTTDPGQAALLRQAIASERAALLATYAEVER
jgi:hypothetical protein